MTKTIIKMGIFMAIVIVLFAILVIAINRARYRGKITECKRNLKALGTYINVNEKYTKTGREFWLELLGKKELDKLAQNDKYILKCPLCGRVNGNHTIQSVDYRGPKKDILNYKKNEPIGADRIGNHGPGKGGNILLMDLSVHESNNLEVREEALGSKLWERANETTCE